MAKAERAGGANKIRKRERAEAKKKSKKIDRDKTPEPKVEAPKEYAELEELERAAYEFDRIGGTEKKQALTSEQRRQILDELFFEGEERWSYVRQFYTLLTISVVIATLGLGMNSAAVVIGGMLLAPLMTPILAISAALVMGWPIRLLRLTLRLVLATGFAYLLAYMVPLAFRIPTEFVIPEQILSRADPELADLIVALAAGAAGAYMLVRREAISALPGVAVAVALVPPLSTSAWLLYLEAYALAWEGFMLYLANLAAIVLSACTILAVMGFRPKVRQWKFHLRLGVGLAGALLLTVLIGVPLGKKTVDSIGELQDRAVAVSVVQEWLGTSIVDVVSVDVDGDVVKIHVQINVPFDVLGGGERATIKRFIPEETTAKRLRAMLIERLGREVKVIVKGSLTYFTAS